MGRCIKSYRNYISSFRSFDRILPIIRRGGASCLEYSVYNFREFSHASIFFLSGFLIRKHELNQTDCYNKNYVRHKLTGIVIPYIVFSIVFWLSKLVMSSQVHNTVGINDLLMIPFYPLSTLWYLYALFIFVLLRIMVHKIGLTDKCMLIVCLILAIISNYISIPLFLEKTVLLRVLKNSLYFQLGITVSSKKYIYLEKTKLAIFLSTTVFFSLFLLSQYFMVTDFSIVIIFLAICGICMVALLSNEISSNFLKYIGKSSLGIYLMHDYFVCLVVIVLKRFPIDMNILVIIATILGLIVPYTIYTICMKNKYLKLVFKPNV